MITKTRSVSDMDLLYKAIMIGAITFFLLFLLSKVAGL